MRGAQKNPPRNYGELIGQESFQWMSILGCVSDRTKELVVLLVNQLVQILCVQEPMSTVEQNAVGSAHDWEREEYGSARWEWIIPFREEESKDRSTSLVQRHWPEKS